MQWQLSSNNKPNLFWFEEFKKVIKALLGFQPKPWQIKGLLNIKQKLDIVIMTDIRFDKSLVF